MTLFPRRGAPRRGGVAPLSGIILPLSHPLPDLSRTDLKNRLPPHARPRMNGYPLYMDMGRGGGFLKEKFSGPARGIGTKITAIPMGTTPNGETSMETLCIELSGYDRQHLRRWECVLAMERWAVRLCSPGEPPREAAGTGLLIAEIPRAQLKAPSPWVTAMKSRGAPVIVAYSEPCTEASCIADVLTAGADDFIHKDIDSRVLVSKVKALARRLIPAESLLLRFSSSDGNITADRAARLVAVRNGHGMKNLPGVTPKELEILILLISREGMAVTREEILDRIWGRKAELVNPETVDKHVESIRKKLGRHGGRIVTIYGAGYMLEGRGRGKE